MDILIDIVVQALLELSMPLIIHLNYREEVAHELQVLFLIQADARSLKVICCCIYLHIVIVWLVIHLRQKAHATQPATSSLTLAAGGTKNYLSTVDSVAAVLVVTFDLKVALQMEFTVAFCFWSCRYLRCFDRCSISFTLFGFTGISG